MSISRYVRVATPVIAVLGIWLFVGIVTVDRMEEEGYYEPFIKKSPTFRIAFFDSYASDPRGEEHEYTKRKDANRDWLVGTYELDEFLQYCKYRFGFAIDDQIKARALCKDANRKSRTYIKF